MLSCSRRCPVDYDSAEDQALVVRMLEADPEAWREFRARFDGVILRCITKTVVRHAAHVDADEVLEIRAKFFTWLCATDMSALRRFDPTRARLSTWIGYLAVNCATSHIRGLHGEPRRFSVDDLRDDAVFRFDGLVPTPLELLEAKESLQITAEALADLSEKDRELLTLSFDEGLEVEEIAARMQISVSTVYTKRHKIRSRLAARIGDDLSLAA